MKKSNKTKLGRKLNKGRKMMRSLVDKFGTEVAMEIGYSRGICQRNIITGYKFAKLKQARELMLEEENTSILREQVREQLLLKQRLDEAAQMAYEKELDKAVEDRLP